MTEGWIINSKGNHVWVGPDGVRATVYETSNGWGGIWNGAADGSPRRLKGIFANAEDAVYAMIQADQEGEYSESWHDPDDQWKMSKAGGVNGTIVSVKQAKSKSWYAVSDGAFLGQNGRSTWFDTAQDACNAVDACAASSGNFCWITRQ